MAEFISWEAEEEEGYEGEEDLEVDDDISDFIVGDDEVLTAEPFPYRNPYLMQSLKLPRGLEDVVKKNSNRVS